MHLLPEVDCGPKAWTVLKELHAPTSVVATLMLERELSAFRLSEGEPVQPVLGRPRIAPLRMLQHGFACNALMDVYVAGAGRAAFKGADGKPVVLHDVLLVPDLKANLISLRKLAKAGVSTSTDGARTYKGQLGNRVLWDLHESKDVYRSMWQLPALAWHGGGQAGEGSASQGECNAVGGVGVKVSARSGETDWATAHRRLGHRAGAAGPRGSRTGGALTEGTGAAGAGGAAGVGAIGAGAIATGCAAGAGAAGSTGAGRAAGVLQPASPLPGPSPYSGPTRGLTERLEPESPPASPESRPASLESRPASPLRTVRTGRRVPHKRPPPVPGTHSMTLRPSTTPQRVPLPSPPASSFPDGLDQESDSIRAASPTVTHFLATDVTDPSFESTAASALVVKLVDFAAACRLDYAASIVAKSESASVYPQTVKGECALSTDVVEDTQEEFECFAAALPHLVSMQLAPEGDPDAPYIPTPRSYAEAIEGPYSSQWQTAMDTEMASWKSTGTYVDEAPPPGANIVSGMWIFRVKRPPGSPPVLLEARFVTRGVSQRQGFDFFQTFSPSLKMTTLRVLLHVAAQRDYDLRRPVYGLRQAPHEWHDTLRTSLAALRFAPSTADPSLFLRTDTTLPPFYVLVYVDNLVFATADTEALAHVKSELQKRPTCTDLGPSGSGSVSSRSTRSFSVLSSSCEAEIYVGAMAALELRWLTYLLTDLGEAPRSPPVLFVDNKAMLALCQEHRLKHRTKHIALRYFLARELQQRGQLCLAYVATRANSADIFTKALQPCDHQRFCTMLVLGPAPSGVSQVDPLPGIVPIEVAYDSGAASGGAEPGGAEPGGAELVGVELRGAEPEGVEPGGAESECAEFGGAESRVAASFRGPACASPPMSPRPEPLSPQQLCEWLVWRARLRSGVVGVGATRDTGAGGAGITPGAGGTGGTAAAGPRGAHTRAAGAGVAGAGGTDVVALELEELELEALDLEELELEALAQEAFELEELELLTLELEVLLV
ncbi:unnamed protein product [Closterium sp. NIES-53]